MTLNELREVSGIEKIYIYNETKKEAYEHEDYSVYRVLCKYGKCKVLRVYSELEISEKSSIDNSMSVKPIICVVIEDKEQL